MAVLPSCFYFCWIFLVLLSAEKKCSSKQNQKEIRIMKCRTCSADYCYLKGETNKMVNNVEWNISSCFLGGRTLTTSKGFSGCAGSLLLYRTASPMSCCRLSEPLIGSVCWLSVAPRDLFVVLHVRIHRGPQM